MKKKASFRIDGNLHDEMKTFADSQGITTSQLIELACYSFMDKKPKPTKQIEKLKKLEIIDISFMVEQPIFKKLAQIVQSKNSTFSQEIRYRLSASIESPIFNDLEFGKLWAIKCDIDRLGNLFKLAIDQKISVNDELFNQVQNNIEDLRKEFKKVLLTANERKLK
ncbi:hypothetical protein ACWIW6_10790 [Ursidibacter sp. B-7004-1]